ncbi:hypothetical protein HZS_8066, partial [Henneguya salminicola]
MPRLEDYVIGKIIKVQNEQYKIDLGGNVTAKLPALSFPNATKKVKPELIIGDIVYAKICLTDPNVDYEVTCCANTKNNSSLGKLSPNNSFLIPISIPLAQRLLIKNSQLVKTLYPDLPINSDIVVGINGFVYVSACTVDMSLKIIEIFKN